MCIIFEHHTEWYSIHEFMVDSIPGEIGAREERREEKRETLYRRKPTGRAEETGKLTICNLQCKKPQETLKLLGERHWGAGY